MNTPKRPRHLGIRGNERIGAFSDGVFAIAITLLVLELRVPEQLPPGGLVSLLPELWPKIAGLLVSFAVLGIYWIAHHNMFMHIERHDRPLLWLNILFLFCVAAMPFLASLITEHGEDRAAVIAYAGTLMVAGLVLDAIWTYASRQRRLVDPNINPELVVMVHQRVLMAPIMYGLAIVVSFFSLIVAKLLFVIVALLYIGPSVLDDYRHDELGASE